MQATLCCFPSWSLLRGVAEWRSNKMNVSYIQVLHLEELVIPMVEKSPSSTVGCLNFTIPKTNQQQWQGKEIWFIYSWFYGDSENSLRHQIWQEIFDSRKISTWINYLKWWNYGKLKKTNDVLSWNPPKDVSEIQSFPRNRRYRQRFIGGIIILDIRVTSTRIIRI
jgi:hypothetical protein